MRLIKRFLPLISASILAGITLLSLQAIPAGAATTVIPYFPGDEGCNYSNPSVGAICVVESSNGYYVDFQNGNIYGYVDFNLVTSSGTYGDLGSFYTTPGQFNSYFFGVGDKGWAAACLYSRDNPEKFAPLCTSAVFG